MVAAVLKMLDQCSGVGKYPSASRTTLGDLLSLRLMLGTVLQMLNKILDFREWSATFQAAVCRPCTEFVFIHERHFLLYNQTPNEQ